MSKIIITIPIDLKIGEIFREQRSRLNLKNTDIFLPFFSNPDFTFLVDNLSLVGSSSFLRTEGEQQTTISVSVDSSVTSKFLSDVSSLTEMTYLGSTNPRKQLTSWARLCVLMFITSDFTCAAKLPVSNACSVFWPMVDAISSMLADISSIDEAWLKVPSEMV